MYHALPPTTIGLDARYIESLQALPSTLLFIMGCHRSGTSLLHHLLAYTGQVNYLTAYEVIHYEELLYNRLTGREARVKADLQQLLGNEADRGLDHLPIGADLPEEYRFLLTTFDLAFSWQARRNLDEMFAPHLTPQTLDKFLELCRKKRFLADADRPLVLKNPADYYFNFLNVHQMLPQAKFIFIHRHPLHILNSYLHSFGALLEHKSAYWAWLDPGYNRLARLASPKRFIASLAIRTSGYTRLLLRRLTASFRYYLDNIVKLPPAQYAVVRYEDLCAAPKDALTHIGTRLQLAITPRIPAHFVTPRSLPVARRAARQYYRALPALQPYLDHFQYPFFPTPPAPPSPTSSHGTRPPRVVHS
jgi:hypothetical protein